MALAFVGKTAGGDNSGTPVASAAVTRNVTAGNLVVIWAKHEGLSTTVTVSDAVDPGVGGTYQSHSNNDLHGRWFYYLATRGGNLTFTVSYAGSRPYVKIHLWEFSYSGAALLDVQAVGQGSATAVTSGTFTTTGTDEVVLGGYGEYSAEILNTPLVNGAAADGSTINDAAAPFSASWYEILSATFSGGAATATLPVANPYICHAIAFKTAVATGPIPGPRSFAIQQRMG